MSTILRPHIPYRGPIYGGLHVGKRIKIRGQAPIGADRFTVNLTTGLDSSTDRLLHISARFQVNTVVRNTKRNGSYGPEEKHGSFPFTMGNNFTLVIEVLPASYKISVNGQVCWDYAHRMPFLQARSVLIDGDVNIERIEFINKAPTQEYPSICTPPTNSVYPSVYVPPSCPVNTSGSNAVPYIFKIYGGITPGMSVHISGRPTDYPQKFSINFQSGAPASQPPPDVAFHFDVRFFNYSIVRNHRINNTWSSEETMISHFPFQPGCNFNMVIMVQSDMYVVMLNGQHFITFRHRLTSFSRFNVLSIENDVIVTSIKCG